MRRPLRFLVAGAAVSGLLTGARFAAAQAEANVNQPPPNVLLLVDSSGSMEYRSGSTEYPICDPEGGVQSEKSRWVELIEVLTGTIDDYRCQAVDRRSAAFSTEYSLSGKAPYDIASDTRYHRPLSGTCTPGPGALAPDSNVYEYPPGAISYHEYSDPGLSCSFSQAQDGLLDVFVHQVRFGLMTFDTHPDPSTGVLAPQGPDYPGGINGTWSYFLGDSHQGHPAGCGKLAPMEVGARNAAAPPWEGRMVAFGSPAEPPTVRNAWIQEILLASRPYGATPINGMLDDARDFLWNDTSKDPLNEGQDFGPYDDDYNAGLCRKNTIILLSDGEPNLDLRPYCEAAAIPAGVCPYAQTPEEIAFDLANAAADSKKTQTFVIAFALPAVQLDASGTTVECKDLSDSDLNDVGGLCDQYPDNKQLQACCTLNRIALNGDTDPNDEYNRAFFPTNIDELRAAVSEVLSKVTGDATSRTLPVTAGNVGGGATGAASYRFYSSFKPQGFDLWSGVLERQRFECFTENGEQVAKAQDIDENRGDDFVYNVNSDPSSRRFYSVQGAVENGSIQSQRSIRMGTGINDGVGYYTGTQYDGAALDFVSSTPPAAMGLTSTSCDNQTAIECRNKYLLWTLGEPNGTVFDRCEIAGTDKCSVIGDIFHSTPAVVGPPSAKLRDESYARFAAEKANRPLVLYTSTNDGFLHAFEVDVNTSDNNELWAFIPPAVLPSMPSQYPGAHQLLLDGPPMVMDVVATQDGDTFRFERSAAETRAGNTTWRTVLLQAFGGARGGYFAIDVTDPDPANGAGPRFLWQLTETADGEPLFGLRGANPIITTLYFDVGGTGGNDIREVAVAVLPGGVGGVPAGSKSRISNTHPDIDLLGRPRDTINAYPPQGISARSLTIVRLDTGEIIRTFRQCAADAPSSLAGRVLPAPLDSPITGTPAAFPGTVGAIADRVFVGDADGVLWRVDLSSTNPNNWEMKMFLDSYSGQAYDAGQPIMTPPILSVDNEGDVVVIFSTGDQEVFSAPADMKNYVWSLSEKLNDQGDGMESRVNWYYEFSQNNSLSEPPAGGERVAGPMNLFVGSLFFSTFQPEPNTGGSVCATGESRVWGMDYLEPEGTGADPDLSLGGKAALPESTDPTADKVPYIDNTSQLLEAGATIFGVGVSQVPACASEAQVTDDFFGGTHTVTTGVTPGKFQLIMHTGGAGTTTVGGQAKVTAIDLPTPHLPARIDSWAVIIE